MDRHEHNFRAYAAGYQSDGRYRLKEDHTLRVYANCVRIAEAEGMDAQTVRAAGIAGLYHDVGRFEQLRRFGTFYDAKSLDHAKLSAHIVKEMGWLEDEPEKEQILEAIALHSSLEARDNVLLSVLRDADKADILYVFGHADIVDVTGHPEAAARNSRISDKVYEQVTSGRLVRKADRQSAIDVWMTYVAFVNDLSYDESGRILAGDTAWLKRFEGPFADARVRDVIALQAERLEHADKKRSGKNTGAD